MVKLDADYLILLLFALGFIISLYNIQFVIVIIFLNVQALIFA